MKPICVVEPTVPRLGHERQTPPISAGVGRAALDSPRNDSVARDSNAVGVSNDNRAFEKSAFFDPMCAGHLAVAVQTEYSRVNRIVQRIMSARNDCGHAGPDWSFTNHKFSFATNDRGVTNFDTNDVGDGVELTGRAIERNAEISCEHGFLVRCRSYRRGFLRLASVNVEQEQ